MKTKTLHIQIRIATSMLLSMGLMQFSYAIVGPGTAWLYVRKITFSPATPAANYQLKVTIPAGQYTHIGTNGNDLRFYDISDNACSYWIETWNTGGISTIWVKAPVSGTSALFMFYGNGAATAASNGTNTFDFFDDGSSLASWTNVNAAVDNTNGVPVPSFKATGTQYAYRDIGLTANKILEYSDYVISGAADLNNLYFLANASGVGQMFRLDSRGSGNYSGFASAASWTTWNAPTTATATPSANTWHSVRIVIGATTASGYIDGTAYGTYTFANNGGYIAVHGDGATVTGGNYDNIRVRRYTATEPVPALGSEVSNNLNVTTTQVNVLCNGQSTGSATATATGGATPYTYSWNSAPMQNTSTANNLPVGGYTATVTDNIGLTAVATVTIAFQPSVIAAASNPTNITCNAANDGTITISASGGTGPYSYSVDNDHDINNLIWVTPSPAANPYVYGGLQPGVAYRIRVKDNNGCISK